eukprot:6477199-Prymnesium_polylepis.1
MDSGQDGVAGTTVIQHSGTSHLFTDLRWHLCPGLCRSRTQQLQCPERPAVAAHPRPFPIHSPH